MPPDLLHALKPWLLVLLLPPMPFFLPLLAAAGLGLWRRHWQFGRALVGLSLLGLWLSCAEGTGQWLVLHGLRAPPALSAAAIKALRDKGDVAVLVLGGGARLDVPEYSGPNLSLITQERLRYGVWLARQIDAPLGYSGGIGWSARHLTVSEASVAVRSAKEEYGLPLRWAEGQSRDTRENARLSLVLLKADGIKTVVLVTHDLHMPRAQQAFVDAAAGEMTIVAAPVGLHRDAMSELTDWMPSGEGLSRVRYAVYEWLALRAGH